MTLEQLINKCTQVIKITDLRNYNLYLCDGEFVNSYRSRVALDDLPDEAWESTLPYPASYIAHVGVLKR